MRMFFSFSLHFSNLPCFFLPCSFFLILALGGRWGPYEALLLSFALNPQPLVLGGGHCLAPAGPQAIGGERRGQSPAGRGRRSRAAQRSVGPEPVLGVGGEGQAKRVSLEEPKVPRLRSRSEILGQV